tara:strand:+ start:436 stop:636 length:201 start_codon:yes stop_codon:yes gene_type:complete
MGLIVSRWPKLKFTSISKEKIIVKDQIELSLHQKTRSMTAKCIITKKECISSVTDREKPFFKTEII